MKRVVVATVALFSPLLAQADVLAVKAGVSLWRADSGISGPAMGQDYANQYAWHAALEHPIPLIPNIKLRYWDYDESGEISALRLSTFDTILYYEIFDNPAIDLDLGVAATNYSNGEVPYGLAVPFEGQLVGYPAGDSHFEGWMPQLYGNLRVPVLGSDLGIYTEITGTRWDGSDNYDFEGGLEYTFDMPVLDLRLRGGYRRVSNDFDDFDDFSGELTFDGWTVGLEADL